MKPIPALFSNIYNNKKLLLISIFLFSLLFSLIFLLFFKNIGPVGHRIPGPDYLNCYEPMADSILKGKGIPIREDSFVRCAPGYPIFLVPIFYISELTGFGRIGLIIFFNVIIAAFSCLFLFLITQSLFSKKIALITSLLWMSYPFNQWFVKNPNTEIPFVFLLFIGMLLYIYALLNKEKRFLILFIVGIALGFNSLIRPISIGLTLILAFLFFFLSQETSKKIKIFLSLVLLAGSLLIVFPWEMYVFSKTGNIIPLSTIGPIGIKFGFSFAAEPGEGGDSFSASDDVMALMQRINLEKIDDIKSIRAVFRILNKEAAANPVAFLKLIFWKIIRSWYATSEMWWEDKILSVQAIYLILGFLGLIYAIKNYKSKIKYILFLLIIMFYFWGITIMALSILRYMIPVMGFLLIFAAIAINTFIERRLKLLTFFKNRAEN